MNKGKLMKITAVFFVFMLCFTVLSRAADQMSIAVVTTARPENKMITHEVKAVGKVVQNRELAVTTEADQRVKTICVSEGDKVEKGDVLFEIDTQLLEEKILEQKQEIEKQELQVKDIKSQKDVSAQQKASQQAQAQEQYALSSQSAGVRLSRAKQALSEAKKELKAFRSEAGGAQQEDGVEDALMEDCEEKADAYILAKQELVQVQWKIENAVNLALLNAKNGTGPQKNGTVHTQSAEDSDVIIQEEGMTAQSFCAEPDSLLDGALEIDIVLSGEVSGGAGGGFMAGSAADTWNYSDGTGSEIAGSDIMGGGAASSMKSGAGSEMTGGSSAGSGAGSEMTGGSSTSNGAGSGTTGGSVDIEVLDDEYPGNGSGGTAGSSESGGGSAGSGSAGSGNSGNGTGSGAAGNGSGSGGTGSGVAGSGSGSGGTGSGAMGSNLGAGTTGNGSAGSGSDSDVIVEEPAASLAPSVTQAELDAVEQSVRESYRLELEAAQNYVETALARKNAAEAALMQYQQERMASSDADRAQTEKQLIAAVTAAQQAYEDAALAANEAAVTSGRAVQQAGIPDASNSSDRMNEITCEQMELRLEKLEQLKRNGGKVSAPADGLITKINIMTGEKTSDTTAILMTDLEKGCRFTAQITKDQEKYIGTGDLVTLEGGKKQKLEELPVESVMADEADDSIYHVTVQIPDNTFALGMTATLQFTRKSEAYPVCVPLSALHLDEKNQAYVLVTDEYESIMGTELRARKVGVTVQEKNESYAALAEGAVSSQQEIIVSTKKAVDEGSRVRIAQ